MKKYLLEVQVYASRTDPAETQNYIIEANSLEEAQTIADGMSYTELLSTRFYQKKEVVEILNSN